MSYKIDTSQYKTRIKDYIEYKNLEIDTRCNPPKIRCPLPGHEDKHPSAVVYEDKIHCFVCDKSLDIFSLAGLQIGSDNFKDQIKEVQSALGEEAFDKNKCVPVLDHEKDNIFRDSCFKWFIDTKEKCEIKGKWYYYNANGDVELIEVRFEHLDPKTKKTEKEFWEFIRSGSQIFPTQEIKSGNIKIGRLRL